MDWEAAQVSPRGPGPRELLEIAAVATRYYRDGWSKVDIAEDLKVSRFRVARLLGLAHTLGIVHIDIQVPDAINPDLSAQLARRFGLRQAIVVDTPDEPVEHLRADLGRVAAGLVAEVVNEGDVVGIAWGRTVNAMTDNLADIRRCSIVQMTGALSGSDVTDNAIDLVRRMSQVSGGTAYPIYAPLMLDDPAAAKAFKAQAQVAGAFSWYDKVNVAIIPIGSWDPPSSQLYDSLNESDRQELLASGVRVDTSTVMLDAAGEVVVTPVSERFIGITGEELRRIPEVVAVAGGRDKAEAIAIALGSGFITTLITNASVARQLLEYPATGSPSAG